MNDNDLILRAEKTDDGDTVLGILQAVVGVLLLIASFFGYSALQSGIVILPALMGAVLLFSGCRTFRFQCPAFKLITAPQ